MEEQKKNGILKNFIEIICNREKIYLNTNCIVYIERVNRQVQIVCENERYMIYDSLNNIGEKLPSEFIRCHIGYIVNSKFINSIGNKSIKIYNGEEISLGRAYKTQITEFLRQKE